MKILLPLLMAFLLVFVASGCGNHQQAENNGNSSTAVLYDKNDLVGQWKLTVYYNPEHTIMEYWTQNISIGADGNLSVNGNNWETVKDMSIDSNGSVRFIEVLHTSSGNVENHYNGAINNLKTYGYGKHDYNGIDNLSDWTWGKIISSNG
jgi:hypothetical protein